jgi:cob(I)alamin adenosyltransferase
MVDALEAHVHRIEAMPGILGDWSLPGEIPDSAAMDVARTICRRAERLAVRLADDGILPNVQILAYLNRLSDLLWLFGRQLELSAGVNAALRPAGQPVVASLVSGPGLADSWPAITLSGRVRSWVDGPVGLQ